MSKEIWKDIMNYEGRYQVSNLGRVRSLDRKVRNHLAERMIKGRIIKGSVNKNGYRYVVLTKENNLKGFSVHQLVAMAFLGHKPNGYKLVVDHIDNNKLNNSLNNLQIIKNRENVSKDNRGVSKYTGVSWNKQVNKWQSHIRCGKVSKNLGTFKSEVRASIAYQMALLQLDKLEKILA